MGTKKGTVSRRRRRRKTAAVLTVAEGPSPAAEHEVWAHIHLILDTANTAGSRPDPIAQQLDAALTLLSHGVPIHSPRHWSFPLAVTFDNLASIVHSGAAHLRRCPTCARWFLATHATRRVCRREDCQKTLVNERQAKTRRNEQAAQRQARVTVKRPARAK